MSFSSDLKMELSQINNLKNKQEVYAEFLGYLASNNIDVKGRNVKFSTESEYNINRFAKLLNNLEIKDYKINITGKTYSIKYKCDEIPILEDAENYLQQDNLKKAYIRSNVINNLPKQVQNEPHLALDGGEDGLKFYKKIIEQACNYIENGYLILEIGYDQKDDVENLLKENKNYSEIKTIQDFSGNDRCIIAKVGKI